MYSGFCLQSRTGFLKTAAVLHGKARSHREMVELLMGPVGKDFDFVGASRLNSGKVLSTIGSFVLLVCNVLRKEGKANIPIQGSGN